MIFFSLLKIPQRPWRTRPPCSTAVRRYFSAVVRCRSNIATTSFVVMRPCPFTSSIIRLITDCALHAFLVLASLNPPTNFCHFSSSTLRADDSPPDGNEKPARRSGHPFEQRISAEPQFIPRLRIFIEGDIPQLGHFAKSLMTHTYQQVFMAAQLANGTLKTLQVCQLRFCTADFA